MEVMEDGNLMDKVHILIQRDMEYYKSKQFVLQETICPGIIGGRLDFPRTASFAALKLVTWWEEEYVAAYRKPSGFMQKENETSRESVQAFGGCGGIVRSSDPAKFVGLITKSSDQLLEHLHVLTQEALDHADLTVLTGTIGAASLLKNCLWFYIQIIKELNSSHLEELQKGYKKYHEMCEALAERLLDLHCRLLSLYILQDADCLDWESPKPFFECERGSYIIQMWFLYMQGTKQDLWNTVPPKMAQRVFAGMLNECLTILTVRYTQSLPSKARSQLLLVDISNLLFCVAQLLPSICDSTEELINICSSNHNNHLRDIHTKCQDLFCCFLLRGAPLDTLYKVFCKKDLQDISIAVGSLKAPTPWITFALPKIFKNFHKPPKSKENKHVINNESVFLALDLMVLLAQPEPNWALLLKVLCNDKFKILNLMLTTFEPHMTTESTRTNQKHTTCDGFLCPSDGSCKNVDTTTLILNKHHYYDLIKAITVIILYIGNDDDISSILISAVTKKDEWSKCFERRHVWSQIRYPWYDAILSFAAPIVPLVKDTIINALKTGATMYQAMSLILACFSQYWDIVNPCLLRVAEIFQEIISTEVVPVSNSTLMQILVAALYSSLIDTIEDPKKEVSFAEPHANNESDTTCPLRSPTKSLQENRSPLKEDDFSNITSSSENVAQAAAEALCQIDEDNKHTDQIDEFLEQVRSSRDDFFIEDGSERIGNHFQMTEILVSDPLMDGEGKQALKVIFHFLKTNSDWLYSQLGVTNLKEIFPNRAVPQPEFILHKMFLIGNVPFDQLLTGELKPNWQTLLQTPMGLSMERVWMQVSQRWEFRDIGDSPHLNAREHAIINSLVSVLKP